MLLKLLAPRLALKEVFQGTEKTGNTCILVWFERIMSLGVAS